LHWTMPVRRGSDETDIPRALQIVAIRNVSTAPQTLSGGAHYTHNRPGGNMWVGLARSSFFACLW
jgi:hypothetical protein